MDFVKERVVPSSKATGKKHFMVWLEKLSSLEKTIIII